MPCNAGGDVERHGFLRLRSSSDSSPLRMTGKKRVQGFKGFKGSRFLGLQGSKRFGVSRFGVL